MKFSLDNIFGGFNLSAINDRLKKIESEFNDKVLYRRNKDDEPNYMMNDLDMNGYKILNTGGLVVDGVPLPAIVNPQSVGFESKVGVSDRYAREDHVHAGLSGTQGPRGIATGLVYAYKRATVQPTDRPGNIVFDFTQGKIVVPPTNDLANGWTKTIPLGSDQLWACVCSASSSSDTDGIDNSEWAEPVLFAQGGINSATVYIYNRTTVGIAPPPPSLDVVYTFGSGLVSNLNNGWTSKVPDVVNGDFLWVSTATAASSFPNDTIPASEWATPQILGKKGDAGTPGANGGISAAVVYAYIRAASVPTTNPGVATYTFSDGRITSPDNLANGWSKTIPSGTDSLYVTVASASSSFATDTIAANEWASPVQLATNGTNGLNTATIYIYKRTTTETIPAVPTVDSLYTFSSKAITGQNNGWAASIPADSAGQYLWVSTATASSLTNTDVITPSEWAAVALMAKNGTNGTSGSNGSNGQRGTVTIAAATTDSFWDNSKAQSAVIAAGYGFPQNRDIVTLYNTAAGFSQTRYYDTGSWLILTAYIDGNLLVSGTLSASKISGGTITGVDININNGSFRVINTGASTLTSAINLYSNKGEFDNGPNPTNVPLTVKNQYISQNAMFVNNTVNGNTAHGIRSTAIIAGSGGQLATGLVGCAAGYDFYAEGAGTNYGPFTGAHDCLFKNGMYAEPGDILVDVKCINRTTLSNTIFEVERSSKANQKAAVGVYVLKQGALNAGAPAALPQDSAAFAKFKDDYQIAVMNAVGEGQINVCGENGDIEAGDFIVTSSTPGKGMKQLDDIHRSYTVARAREAVKFSKPGEQKQIACIYLCG